MVDAGAVLKELATATDGLQYGQEGQLDLIIRRAFLVVRKAFGPDSPYIDHLQNISFRSGAVGAALDVKTRAWERGRSQLTNLLITMKEDHEWQSQQGVPTAALTGPSVAPTFWDLLHPAVTRASKSRYESKHFADAVRVALVDVNNRVKDHAKTHGVVGFDGTALMRRALSRDQPLIVVGDLDTESGRNEQEGYSHMMAGAMLAIRDPKSHENVEIDPSRAIHLLFLASLFNHRLDEAAVK